MPITETGIGHSKHTFEKENDFFYIIKESASLVHGYEIKFDTTFPFCYIDLFAGNGKNEKIGCEGSPITAYRAIKTAKIENYIMRLIDVNTQNCQSLINTIKNINDNIVIINDKCEVFLNAPDPGILGLYGCMVVDPNGDPKIEEIKRFYLIPGTEIIDVIIRVSTTNYKRILSTKEIQTTLIEELTKIKKTKWFIKTPSTDQFRWTTIFGTNNNKFTLSKKKGFFDIKSNEGQAILDIITNTNNDPNKYNPGQTSLLNINKIRAPPKKKIKCKFCKKIFETKYTNQIYCCDLHAKLDQRQQKRIRDPDKIKNPSLKFQPICNLGPLYFTKQWYCKEKLLLCFFGKAVEKCNNCEIDMKCINKVYCTGDDFLIFQKERIKRDMEERM